MKKTIFLVILTVILCILVVHLLPPSEKTQVKNDIEALKDAVEEKDTVTTFSYIDESYYDKNFTKPEELKEGIRDFFTSYDSINIGLSNIKVTIDSIGVQKTIFANCNMGLKVFAQYEGGTAILYGDIVKPAPVRVYLKKSGRQYKIYYVEY